MGGLFRTPKLAAPDDGAAAGMRADAAEADARRRELDRTRRGLAGTLATSSRGVLAPLPASLAARRKSLLGE